MAKKTGISSKTAKTAKKKPAAPKPAAGEPVVENVQPRFVDYVRATFRVAANWIKSHKLRAVVGLVIVVLIAGGIVLLSRDEAVFTNDEIVIRVSRELGINGDANPAILEVVNESRVNQPFLEEARNGDKVLLYYKSGQSVLFRPSEDRIIRTGTYTPPDAKLFVRQGTQDDARLAEVKQKIDRLEGLKIVSQDYSTNRLNDKTVVVSITDRYPEAAQRVAEALGAELTRLPQGETIPDADILVIVGSQ